ncbi:MAG TPA: MFS transporter, partial [Candidatus Limnocylindrales bacterium]
QQSTPDGERGRVMSVLQAAMSAASILSMGFAGLVGDAVGIREVFFIAAAITGVGCIVSVVGYRGGAADAPAERVASATPAVPAPNG